MLKGLGHEISRTSMAHWVIRLDGVFKPLINLMREAQKSADYLQVDESRMYVLKKDGKTGCWKHCCHGAGFKKLPSIRKVTSDLRLYCLGIKAPSVSA